MGPGRRICKPRSEVVLAGGRCCTETAPSPKPWGKPPSPCLTRYRAGSPAAEVVGPEPRRSTFPEGPRDGGAGEGSAAWGRERPVEGSGPAREGGERGPGPSGPFAGPRQPARPPARPRSPGPGPRRLPGVGRCLLPGGPGARPHSHRLPRLPRGIRPAPAPKARP